MALGESIKGAVSGATGTILGAVGLGGLDQIINLSDKTASLSATMVDKASTKIHMTHPSTSLQETPILSTSVSSPATVIESPNSNSELSNVDLSDAETFHRDFEKIIAQFKVMTSLNKELADIANNQRQVMDQTSDKILNRQEVTQQEAQEFLEAIDAVKSSVNDLSKSDISIEVSVKDIIAQYSDILKDMRYNESIKRDIVKELITLVENQQIATQELKDLKSFDLSKLKSEDITKLTSIIDKIEIQSEGKVIKDSLDNFHKKLDYSILSSNEIQDTLDKKSSHGESLKEAWVNNPGEISMGGLRKGGIETVLGAVGLGGLSQVFGLGDKLDALMQKGTDILKDKITNKWQSYRQDKNTTDSQSIPNIDDTNKKLDILIEETKQSAATIADKVETDTSITKSALQTVDSSIERNNSLEATQAKNKPITDVFKPSTSDNKKDKEKESGVIGSAAQKGLGKLLSKIPGVGKILGPMLGASATASATGAGGLGGLGGTALKAAGRYLALPALALGTGALVGTGINKGLNWITEKATGEKGATIGGKIYDWLHRDVGKVSEKYESGGKGAATVSTGKGDAGGASYGTYQLASKTGTLNKYLSSSGYANQFQGLKPGTPEFNAKWKELAASDSNFAKSQHEFIKNTHFNPTASKAEKAGFNIKDRGIQEALWSQGVQHSGKGNQKIIDAARQQLINQYGSVDAAPPEEQIKALYSARGSYASQFASGSATVGRYNKEMQDAIAMSKASKEVKATDLAQVNKANISPTPVLASTENVATSAQVIPMPTGQARDQILAKRRAELAAAGQGSLEPTKVSQLSTPPIATAEITQIPQNLGTERGSEIMAQSEKSPEPQSTPMSTPSSGGANKEQTAKVDKRTQVDDLWIAVAGGMWLS